ALVRFPPGSGARAGWRLETRGAQGALRPGPAAQRSRPAAPLVLADRPVFSEDARARGVYPRARAPMLALGTSVRELGRRMLRLRVEPGRLNLVEFKLSCCGCPHTGRHLP